MARPRGTRQERDRALRLASGGGKFLGYIRVSTAGQEQDGHSLDGQAARLRLLAEAEGLELLEIVQDVESGAKQRDNLDAAWARVQSGEAEGLVIMRLDRLGRSLRDLAALKDEAKELQASILAVDGGWQVRRGEVNGALSVLMGVAEMERELVSRRTKEGLAVARRKGQRLGRPPENTDLQEEATRLRRRGMTLQAIADRFNAAGHRTARGCLYHPKAIMVMVNRVDPTANPVGGHPGNALVAAA